jgi:hypothetical protein
MHNTLLEGLTEFIESCHAPVVYDSEGYSLFIYFFVGLFVLRNWGLNSGLTP